MAIPPRGSNEIANAEGILEMLVSFSHQPGFSVFDSIFASSFWSRFNRIVIRSAEISDIEEKEALCQ